MRSDKTGVHKVHKSEVGVLVSGIEEEARFQAEKREGARGAPGYVFVTGGAFSKEGFKRI